MKTVSLLSLLFSLFGSGFGLGACTTLGGGGGATSSSTGTGLTSGGAWADPSVCTSIVCVPPAVETATLTLGEEGYVGQP